MRRADDPWPAVGSRLNYSLGVWLALVNDKTTVLEGDPLCHADFPI